MKTPIRIALIGLGVLVLGAAALAARQGWAAMRIAREAKAAPVALGAPIGATNTLEITPLYEDAGDAETFQVGHGVSYLIRVNEQTILLDVGNDPTPEDGDAPLARNMAALGISWGDISTIVLSHPHPDHMGGVDAWRAKTLNLGDGATKIGQTPILAPITLTCPGGRCVETHDPTLVAPGAATIGAMPYLEVWQLALFNPRGIEQSLAVNIAGRGIVLITGCGHPGVTRLVERIEALFDEPLVGVVGGLHYDGAAADKWQRDIAYLQGRELALVALSPHDSGGEAAAAYRAAFPGAYQEIAVGRTIRLVAP